jgi:hypothetical protein
VPPKGLIDIHKTKDKYLLKFDSLKRNSSTTRYSNTCWCRNFVARKSTVMVKFEKGMKIISSFVLGQHM